MSQRTIMKIFEFIVCVAGAYVFHLLYPNLLWWEYGAWVVIMMVLIQSVTNHYYPKIKQ